MTWGVYRAAERKALERELHWTAFSLLFMINSKNNHNISIISLSKQTTDRKNKKLCFTQREKIQVSKNTVSIKDMAQDINSKSQCENATFKVWTNSEIREMALFIFKDSAVYGT